MNKKTPKNMTKIGKFFFRNNNNIIKKNKWKTKQILYFSDQPGGVKVSCGDGMWEIPSLAFAGSWSDSN